MSALSRARAVVDAHAEKVRPLLTCRGVGCHGCCHGPVFVSLAEWAAIEPHVTRSQRNAARLIAGTIADYRCPLLDDDNRCSVYEDRPLVCRSFNSTVDPKRCIPGVAGRASPELESRRVLGEAHRAMGVRFEDCADLSWKIAGLSR